MSGIDRKYVDAAGDQWTWHHDGQDRMTSEAHPGLNYAPYYVDERYGPLAAVELVAAAEARGYARAVQALRDEDERIRASLTDKRGRLDWEAYEPTYDLAADHLEALTQQEGGTDG